MAIAEGMEYTCADGCLRVRLLDGDILTKPEPTVKRIAGIIEHTAPRVTLIDFRLVPTPTTFGALYSLGEVAGLHLADRPIVALIRPDQADRGEIGKLVANNRGAQVERFLDEAAAEAWIKWRFATREPGRP